MKPSKRLITAVKADLMATAITLPVALIVTAIMVNIEKEFELWQLIPGGIVWIVFTPIIEHRLRKRMQRDKLSSDDEIM